MLAEDPGISRATCELLHLEYLNQLTRSAWVDGILTEDETGDLVRVGDVLDIPITPKQADESRPERPIAAAAV